MTRDDQNATSGRRPRRLRWTATVTVIVAVVVGHVVYNTASLSTTTAPHPIAHTALQSTDRRLVSLPAVPTINWQDGRDTMVLAVVSAPTGQHCVQMRVLDSGQTYRLLWESPEWTAISGRSSRQLWWLTGHTLPVKEVGDHVGTAADHSGCDSARTFYVDGAITVSRWLSELLCVLLPPALTSSLPSTTACPMAQSL